MAKRTLNALLAIKKQGEKVIRASINDTSEHFIKRQGSFKGEKKTYSPYPDEMDKETEKCDVRVAITVDEDLKWLTETIIPKLQDIINVETTNSCGAAKVTLAVGDVVFGECSAVELMKLKNILNDAELNKMFASIPIRDSKTNWNKSTDPDLAARGIYETDIIASKDRTSEKDIRIVPDPNFSDGKFPSHYTPVTVQTTKTREIADRTRQLFSGEWSLEQRASLLRRLSDLKTAVELALQAVNDTEVIKSDIDFAKIFSYIMGK